MRVSRIRLVPLALLVLSLVVAPSAWAAARVTTTDVVHADVPWTIPAGQCSSLPAGVSVSGTGKRHSVTITTTFPDGSMKIVNNDVVTGKAVDSNGRNYQFL